MAKTTISTDPISAQTIVTMVLDKEFEIRALESCAMAAREKLADEFIERNMTQILSKVDLTGLANLIAIKASKALKD